MTIQVEHLLCPLLFPDPKFPLVVELPSGAFAVGRRRSLVDLAETLVGIAINEAVPRTHIGERLPQRRR